MYSKTSSLPTSIDQKTYRFIRRALFFSGILIMFFTQLLLAQKSKDAYKTERFNVTNGVTIDATTSGGHIEVLGGNGSEVEVQVFVRKRGKYLDLNDYDLSDDFEFVLGKSGNTITVSCKRENAKWKKWNNNQVTVSYIIKTPTEAEIDLKTSGGHIEVSKITGNVDLNTSGGHITLANISGNIEARTSGGHIKMADLYGEVNARTSGGHIDLNEAQGIFDLRTSGGHIDINKFDGAVSARTSGGSINADLKSVNGNIELRTSGGSINASMPATTGADLKVQGTRVKANLVDFTGSQTKNSIEGSVNGGGNKVVMSTSGGTVRLDFVKL